MGSPFKLFGKFRYFVFNVGAQFPDGKFFVVVGICLAIDPFNQRIGENAVPKPVKFGSKLVGAR